MFQLKFKMLSIEQIQLQARGGVRSGDKDGDKGKGKSKDKGGGKSRGGTHIDNVA